MEEKKRYVFKKDYVCQYGKINEGREIVLFNGMMLMDGVIIPEPFATDIRKIFSDDKFIKEYISIETPITNKI